MTPNLHATWYRPLLSRWARRLPGRWLPASLLTLLLCYGLWPYATLWRLDQAVISGDQITLDRLVDLTAIRAEIARRLNKDRASLIGDVSEPFIQWLESGIHHSGTQALNMLVTLDWVHERLGSKTPPGQGFLSALTYGFFDGPRDFRARIGRPDANPVILGLRLGATGWRITMLYD